jgi:hypothetical protein
MKRLPIIDLFGGVFGELTLTKLGRMERRREFFPTESSSFKVRASVVRMWSARINSTSAAPRKEVNKEPRLDTVLGRSHVVPAQLRFIVFGTNSAAFALCI